MKLELLWAPLLWPVGMIALQLWRRRPYIALSLAAHALLLALLYYFGSYQVELREQQAEVASSLRATHVASAAKRLQDLQTIKELLEKSAERDEAVPAASAASASPAEAATPPAAPAPETPETPEQMVAQAREVSKAIDTLDKKIQAKELEGLTGKAQASPAAEAASAAATDRIAKEASAGASAPLTPEAAAQEIGTLEAKARATLAKRLQRLEAKANGVPVEGGRTDPSARARIADFIGEGKRLEAANGSQRYTGSDFFHHGQARIPPVNRAGLVLGSGRMLGAGGEHYANRVYLNSWYLIGPFPGRHEAGLFDNPAYPPEKAVLLDAVYYGKDQRLLKWRYVTAQSYPLEPPDNVPDSVYYGYTEVFLDEARDLTAWIGADDDVQLYLNDRLVWKGGNVNKQSYFEAIFNSGAPYLRDYNRTEGQRVLHFNKGRNTLFFKLSNGPNGAFLSLVLTP